MIKHSFKKSFIIIYQRLWICKDLSLERNCREGNGGIEKRSYSLSLYFYMSHAMELIDKVRKVLRFLTECLSP